MCQHQSQCHFPSRFWYPVVFPARCYFFCWSWTGKALFKLSGLKCNFTINVRNLRAASAKKNRILWPEMRFRNRKWPSGPPKNSGAYRRQIPPDRMSLPISSNMSLTHGTLVENVLVYVLSHKGSWCPSVLILNKDRKMSLTQGTLVEKCPCSCP